jgi:tRNA (cytosine38-C5)-methyltransferase
VRRAVTLSHVDMAAPCVDPVARDEVALEFFSGIGGLHYALSMARPGAVVARAFDVDDIATRVYASNFGPRALVTAADVCQLEPETLNRFGAGLWMLSPPCQPYTRQGNTLGAKDARASGIAHLTALLGNDQLEPPTRLLMENVVGFESSESRDELARVLRARGFAIREFWISPVHLGIPNQRTRYFLIARQDVAGVSWPAHELLDAHELPEWGEGEGRPLPVLPRGCVRVERPLSEFLDDGPDAWGPSAAGPDDAPVGALPAELIAKYRTVLDVVTASSTHSSCFTKNYARYVKGTGSVLAVALASEDALDVAAGDGDLAAWGLRFMSPREIANLHGFPRGAFNFPADISLRKRYNLLGNSLSIDVVAMLLRFLYEV